LYKIDDNVLFKEGGELINVRKLLQISFVVLVLAVCFITKGCKNCTDIEADPVGELLASTNCKHTQSQLNDIRAGNLIADDCVSFSYDGDGTLMIKHINAGFNCCPGRITAEIEINENRITIVEKESESGCHCLCLYDLDYKIENLPPGEYIFQIVEPYISAEDAPIEITLKLKSAIPWDYCFPRKNYPWF